ncbi:unnamed protein product, partial [Rotaria sp. Silwood2]
TDIVTIITTVDPQTK